MDFLTSALNSPLNGQNKTLTENDAVIHEDTEHVGVTAFNKLVRDETRNVKTGKILNSKYFISKNRKKYLNSKINYQQNVEQETETETETEQETEQEPKPEKLELKTKTKNTLELETSVSANAVKKYFGDMLNEIKKRFLLPYDEKTKQLVLDSFTLPFYKRCFTKTIKNEDGSEEKHTGEGERLIFYQMIIELYLFFPETVLNLVKYISDFGYFGDLFSIWQLMDKREKEDTTLENKFKYYKSYVLHFCRSQLSSDKLHMDNKVNVSLLAKWIPRESSAKDKTCTITIKNNSLKRTYTVYTALSILHCNNANAGACDIYGYIREVNKSLINVYPSDKLQKYRGTFRKLLSSLNKYLDTFEIKACSHSWSKIDINKIPSKAMLKYNTAFLNEKKNEPLGNDMEETGNRYPEDEDRIKARKNLIAHVLSSADIKISGVEPHEILMAYSSASTVTQKLIAMKQWDSKVEEVFNSFVEKEGLDVDNLESLKTSRMCNLIPMMDVSGSMSGVPMDVSIGLGLFLVALQKKCGLERQIAISFTDIPRVFDFTDMELYKQIEFLRTHVGYGTNFESAIDLILNAIKESGEHKDLIVFTDGQFNQMNIVNVKDNWETCHQRILKKVANLKLQEVPNIIYWNLRVNTPGVQATCDQVGVQLLQGYSPAIMKFALYGSDETKNEITIVDDEGVENVIIVSSKTPYQTYRQALDQTCFDVIRNVVLQSNEGPLQLVV